MRQTGHADIALVAADEIAGTSIPAGNVPPDTIVSRPALRRRPQRYGGRPEPDRGTDPASAERSVSRAPQPFDGFLQVSGLQIHYRPGQPEGKRVSLAERAAAKSGRQRPTASPRPAPSPTAVSATSRSGPKDIAEDTGVSIAAQPERLSGRPQNRQRHVSKAASRRAARGDSLHQPRLCLPALPLARLPAPPAHCRLPHASRSSRPRRPRRPAPSHSAFDGDRAFADLNAQCDLGPRPPGSAAHEKCRAYILKQLTPYVDKVDTQAFTFHDPDRHVTLHLTNIIGVINPHGRKKVMLFTHWDTRPTADQDLDHKDKPIIGADDGASGTAALLELARVFHAKRPTVGVVLLFVDGEDWGPGEDKMYLGARHFAQHPGAYKPDYAILLDMIGDKDLNIYREVNSQSLHPDSTTKSGPPPPRWAIGPVPRQSHQRQTPSATTTSRSTPPASPPLT